MSKVSGLGLPPPSSDHQTDGPGPFGGKLKAARSYHRQPDQFGNDGCKPSEPQRLFAGFEDELLLDRFDIDHTIRMEANLGQCRSEEVWASEAPDDLSLRASRDTGNKERGCSPINRPCPTSGEFVDRTICQAAAGKMRVDLSHPEWENGFWSSNRPFEMLDALSKIGNEGVCAGLRHSEPIKIRFSSRSEASMFLFCSLFKCESMRIYRRAFDELQPDKYRWGRRTNGFNRVTRNQSQARKCHR